MENTALFTANNVWMMICTGLVFFMHLGFTFLEIGLQCKFFLSCCKGGICPCNLKNLEKSCPIPSNLHLSSKRKNICSLHSSQCHQHPSVHHSVRPLLKKTTMKWLTTWASIFICVLNMFCMNFICFSCFGFVCFSPCLVCVHFTFGILFWICFVIYSFVCFVWLILYKSGFYIYNLLY